MMLIPWAADGYFQVLIDYFIPITIFLSMLFYIK